MITSTEHNRGIQEFTKTMQLNVKSVSCVSNKKKELPECIINNIHTDTLDDQVLTFVNNIK